MPQPIETAPKDGTPILTDVGIVRSPYPKQQRKRETNSRTKDTNVKHPPPSGNLSRIG